MKRKLLAITMVLCLLFGILAGCGSTTSEAAETADTSSATETAASAAETPEEAAEEAAPETASVEAAEPEAEVEVANSINYPISDGSLELTLAMGIPEFILQAVEGMKVENIAAFKAAAEACGVNLVVTSYGMEVANEQINLMVASADYPDMVNSLTEHYASGAVGAIEDEICVDILAYAEEFAPDYLKYYNENETYRKDVTDDNGRVASMYGAQEANYNISGLMLRGDYLTELGLEVPTTYDELADVLLAMKNEYDVEYPAFFSGDIQLGSIIHGYGIDTNTYSVDSDGNVVYNYVTDEFKAYITMLSEWFNDGLINMDMLLNGNVSPGESIAYLADGRAVLLSGESDFMSASNRNIATDDNYDVIAIPDPTLEKGGTLRVGGENGSASTTVGWSVNANSEVIEEAIMFMNWFWTDAGQLASNYGIENEGFVYDAEGNPQYTDLILNNEVVGFAAAWRGYTSFQAPSLAWTDAVVATYTHESQAGCAEVWSTGRSLEGTYNGTLTVEENELVSQYSTDLSTLADERLMKFVIGELNMESDWDTYISDMEQLGLATCIETYQAAYDRYLAK